MYTCAHMCVIYHVCGEYEWVHLHVLHGWVCLCGVWLLECMSECYCVHVIMCTHMGMCVSKCICECNYVSVHEHREKCICM